MIGVQKMQGTQGPQGELTTRYAIPIATSVPGAEEGAPVSFKPQPLAWIAERNMPSLGAEATITSMPDTFTGAQVDHIILGEKAMNHLVGATHAAVFGSQVPDKLVVAAQALGNVTGDGFVNLGIRIDADILSFTQ